MGLLELQVRGALTAHANIADHNAIVGADHSPGRGRLALAVNRGFQQVRGGHRGRDTGGFPYERTARFAAWRTERLALIHNFRICFTEFARNVSAEQFFFQPAHD